MTICHRHLKTNIGVGVVERLCTWDSTYQSYHLASCTSVPCNIIMIFWLQERLHCFADVCFKEFGDRLLHWTAFNEANVFALGGYDSSLPPGCCSLPARTECIRGNSSTEPYIVAHNILLAHSAAVDLHKKTYKATQHGILVFNIFIYWIIPYTNTTDDLAATQRALDFYVGWFLTNHSHDLLLIHIFSKLNCNIQFLRKSRYISGSFFFPSIVSQVS